MEENENKVITKRDVVFIILGILLITVWFCFSFLSFAGIAPEYKWAGDLCGSMTWLFVGLLNWKKLKWLSIINFSCSAVYAVTAALGIIHQYF